MRNHPAHPMQRQVEGEAACKCPQGKLNCFLLQPHFLFIFLLDLSLSTSHFPIDFRSQHKAHVPTPTTGTQNVEPRRPPKNSHSALPLPPPLSLNEQPNHAASTSVRTATLEASPSPPLLPSPTPSLSSSSPPGTGSAHCRTVCPPAARLRQLPDPSPRLHILLAILWSR